MFNKITIILFLTLTQVAFSQTENESTSNTRIYFSNEVTTVPQFVGGQPALNSFLKANFVQPKKSKVKGEVLVAFVVEIDGSLTEIGVLSDAGFGTADEAIRVMSISPSWIPGTLNGRNVRVQHLLKIPVNQQL